MNGFYIHSHTDYTHIYIVSYTSKTHMGVD